MPLSQPIRLHTSDLHNEAEPVPATAETRPADMELRCTTCGHPFGNHFGLGPFDCPAPGYRRRPEGERDRVFTYAPGAGPTTEAEPTAEPTFERPASNDVVCVTCDQRFGEHYGGWPVGTPWDCPDLDEGRAIPPLFRGRYFVSSGVIRPNPLRRVRIIAYTYDAAIHCVRCASFRHAVPPRTSGDQAEQDENGIPADARDSEGNPIHPVYVDDAYELAHDERNDGLCEAVCEQCLVTVADHEHDEMPADEDEGYSRADRCYCEHCVAAAAYTGEVE